MLKIIFDFFSSLFPKKHKKNSTKITIPTEINGQEVILRGILSPIFYSRSKKRFSDNAFLPPPNKQDVSVLRRNYTTDNFCKNHLLNNVKIKDSEYIGIASFFAKAIKEVNEALGTQECNVGLKYTPISHQDYELEMHADIFYNVPNTKGEPYLQLLRSINHQIAKKAKMYEDPNPTQNDWEGEELLPFFD